MSERAMVVVQDISVAYVVVVVVVIVVVVVVVISLGTMVQFPVQHSSQEVKNQLAELATRSGGQTSWTFKNNMEEEKRKKRRVNQSSSTSEHAITGRVATAKGKRGGAIRVHSISSMEPTNRNSYF